MQGYRFPCAQCDFTATKKSYVTEHTKAKHLGITFPCDECEYAATKKSNLKQHVELKHIGIRYSCDQCSYVAARFSRLETHISSKHRIDASNSEVRFKGQDKPYEDKTQDQDRLEDTPEDYEDNPDNHRDIPDLEKPIDKNSLNAVWMSIPKTELVYEADQSLEIEECKLEPLADDPDDDFGADVEVGRDLIWNC